MSDGDEFMAHYSEHNSSRQRSYPSLSQMRSNAYTKKSNTLKSVSVDSDTDLPPAVFSSSSSSTTAAIRPEPELGVADSDPIFENDFNNSHLSYEVHAQHKSGYPALHEPHSTALEYGVSQNAPKKSVAFVNPAEVESWSPMKHFTPIEELIRRGGDIAKRVDFIVNQFGKGGGGQAVSRTKGAMSMDIDEGLAADWDSESRFQNPRGRGGNRFGGRGRGRGAVWASKRRGGNGG